MDGLWILLVLIVGVVALGTPVMALIAFLRSGETRRSIEALQGQIRELRAELAQRGPRPAVEPQAAAPPATPAPPQDDLPPAIAPAAAPPPAPPSWQPAPPLVAPAADSLPPLLTPGPVPAASVARKPAPSLEQWLGARAFVWGGGVVLALAAIFLVRYSIEQGYLSPTVRVILAALFGAGLIVGGDRLRGRDDRVAQALTAAGAAALYGALFSAVALYEMVPRFMGGVLALALTAGCIVLSLRHGIFVAVLAFVGGFVSPLVIGGETPNILALFGYLLATAAGTLAVIRHRGWWVLGWGVLAGTSLWSLFWMVLRADDPVRYGADGQIWVGLFLVGVAALFVWATWQRVREQGQPTDHVVGQVWAATLITGGLLVGIAVGDPLRTAGWLCLGLYGAGIYALARYVPRFQYLAGLPPLLSLSALAIWWFVHFWGGPTAEEVDAFGPTLLVMGGGFAIAAFALMWNAGRPGFWAGVTVGATLLHFLLGWYTLRGKFPAMPWSLLSLGLALPFLAAADRLARWRGSMPGATEALGVMAAGVTFFVAAAIPLELRREWITVAYAFQLTAIAWIGWKLDVLSLRWLCWPLLGTVMVRFVLNPYLLDYPLGGIPFLNWILWAYGLTIVAFWLGGRFLSAVRQDPLSEMVKASTVLLGFVLLTLEVRSIFQPSGLSAAGTTFYERATLVLAWGGFALVALHVARRTGSQVALMAWRIVGALSAALAILVQSLAMNPIAESVRVGTTPLFNGLLVGYLLPALLAALALRMARQANETRAVAIAAITAMILAFAWVTLEVRHVFDPVFAGDPFDAEGVELYTYSAAWLVFGLGLLAIGMWRHVPALRHAGMIMVLLVVAKVFLIDMSGLQGLLRVLSFLGLGAALVGLGYAYRRFVFAADERPELAPPEPPPAPTTP
ncbi:MAG: DUF2339 domain-containing protein [Alphaproteobacteria bacterium]|nr:DUF2339 domain-containing protein [Alphaproteobacteria bacterium]